MSREVTISLISVGVGALLGGILTFLSTYGYDIIKENRERINLAKMIYIDVQNAETTLYTMLDKLPLDEALKHDCITANDFDTRVFEAYMQKIPILSEVDAARVLSFYGELIKANEAMHILQDKNITLTPEDRKFWIKFFYEKLYKSIRNGRRIMEDFEKEYKIKPLGNIKKIMDVYEKKILHRNPELKSKIIIPEGEL